ncbi:MAG: MFS transporter [Chloroflexi bacterium]|nr:MFS transporter [Chloroflexota bacterium]
MPSPEANQPEGGPEEGTVSAWASLGIRDFRLLWFGSVFATTAREMRVVVNFYLVFELTGDPLQLGLTGLFQAIPIMLFGLFGGALADLLDRRKLLMATQVLGMIPALALGVLAMTGGIEVWHIFLATFATSATSTLEFPARMAYMVRLVPRSHLLNAITLNSLLNQTAFFIGPALTGLVVLVGVDGTFFFNAALFVPGLLAIAMIRTSGAPEGERQGASLKMIVEGVRFISREKILLSMLAMDFGVVMVGFFRPLLTVLAKDVFGVGAVGLGFLNAAPAVGSVLASSTILIRGRIRRQGATFLTAVFLYSASLSLLGTAPWYGLGLLAAGLLGYTDSISVAVRQNLTQLVAPDAMRGRATGFSVMSASLGNAIGSMEAGFVAAIIGAAATLTFGGVAAMVFVLACGFGWKELWRHRV